MTRAVTDISDGRRRALQRVDGCAAASGMEDAYDFSTRKFLLLIIMEMDA